MNINKTLIAKITLDVMKAANFHRCFGDKFVGAGVILTLHHVLKESDSSPFKINRLLEITPDFLEQTIRQVCNLGYDIISLDEVRQRLLTKDTRKFVCFTLDDGYVDNYHNAVPIFKKFNVPFAIYVSTGIVDGTAILWWRCLEQILLKQNAIELDMNGKATRFTIRSLKQKQQAFDKIYWYLRAMPLDKQHGLIKELAAKYDFSIEQLCLNSALSWEMLKEIAKSPLATIGTHTTNHLALGKLSVDEVKQEVLSCRDRLSEQLQIAADHFCYPYGDQASADTRDFKIIEELGFKTATTTRKAVTQLEHAQQLHALPRIPLNGHYQKQHYVELLLSGVPTGLWQQLKGGFKPAH